MCGICGIVNRNPSWKVDGGVLVSMTRALSHRGPDDEGYFLDGKVGLGHRRLSIIDRSGGHQPIFNEDRSIVVIFNGEIYNFVQLRQELISRGHRFKTRSDTETIVHAYEEYGDDCVAKLRGMFAFAVWDQKRQRLFLARDRLGIKPLYIYTNGDFIAFASEIKALLTIPGIPREIEPTSLDLYLSLRYVPGPRTMFKNILKLQPAHTLQADHSGVQIRKYWDIEHSTDPALSPNDYEESFERLLEESVRLRLVADVPLGVFLSGGLDSSSILAVMSRIRTGSQIKTFSVGYEATAPEEEESNEFAYARMVAQAFGTEHHEFRVRPGDFSNFLPDLVWHLDEPMADPTCIPLYFLSQLARQHVTVILSGEGADETLAGYGYYQRMLALERIYRVTKPFASVVSRLADCLPEERLRHYARLSTRPLERRYRGISRAFPPELKGKLLGKDGAATSEELLSDIFGHHFENLRRAHPLEQMLHIDCKIWLVEDLLLKADKMTMAHALELRVPFLDHVLVEYAAGLPSHLKINGRSGKYILRKIMRNVLPQSTLERTKKGFPTPWRPWLRVPLREFTREALLDSGAACHSYMDPAVVAQTVRDHERGKNRQQELWALLVFEFWHREFMRGGAKGPHSTRPQEAPAILEEAR